MNNRSTRNKLNLRAIIVLLAVLILAFMFVFNLFKSNRNAKIAKEKVKANITKVSKFNFSTVVDVEAELQKMKEAENSGSKDGKNYRTIFANCAIVGDSITEGLTVYGFLGEEQVFSAVGGAVSKDEAMFDKAAATYPKAAFFSYGMNDMGNFNGDADSFIEQYSNLINKFKKKSPKTKIFVNGISTPDESAISANKVLGNYKNFNNKIKAMCKKLKVTYIDTAHILVDDPSLYAGDGIHVQPAYYVIWLDLMQKKAGL